jgi:hypothetical protein
MCCAVPVEFHAKYYQVLPKLVRDEVPAEFQADYDTTIAEIAGNLGIEDKSALIVREILQRLTEKKEPDGFRKD